MRVTNSGRHHMSNIRYRATIWGHCTYLRVRTAAEPNPDTNEQLFWGSCGPLVSKRVQPIFVYWSCFRRQLYWFTRGDDFSGLKKYLFPHIFRARHFNSSFCGADRAEDKLMSDYYEGWRVLNISLANQWTLQPKERESRIFYGAIKISEISFLQNHASDGGQLRWSLYQGKMVPKISSLLLFGRLTQLLGTIYSQ